MIQKKFITYNLKIKVSTPYPILLFKFGLSPIESAAMFTYLTYKKKLDNMETKRLPKIASKCSQNPHLHLKRRWHKDAQSWFKHWRIKEELNMETKIISKILLRPSLRTSCGRITSWRVKGS